MFVLSLGLGRLFESASYERFLTADAGLSSWGRLFSSGVIPDGTTLSYSIGRVVGGEPTYDLGPQYTDISGPLPDDGINLSGLNQPILVARVDFSTTQPEAPIFLSPTLRSLFATYRSDVWPEFTFVVEVDDPIDSNIRAIDNTVAIFTDTPELRTDNNQASANMNVLLTNLAVRKSVSQSSVNPGDGVTFTLDWDNLGPQGAVNATLVDTLPAGFTFVSASLAPDSISGQELTWNLGDPLAGASGSIDIETTVEGATAPGTYINTVRVANDRQDTNPQNNADNVSVLVVALGNPLPTDVGLIKSGPLAATLGSTVLYTLDYRSTGGGDAAGVVVTDTLPAGLTFLGPLRRRPQPAAIR
jgi:uncharacterized repeat protein (TIGR01451 family)